MIRIIAVLLLFIASPCFGQVLIVGSNPTSYHIVTRDASGKVVLQQVKQVVTLDETPVPVPPKPPTDKFGLSVFVKAEAAKVKDSDTQAAIAQIYQLLSDKIRDGSIKDPQTAATAAKTAVDLFLSQSGKKAEWKTFQTNLKARLDKLASEGKIKTVEDIGQAYSEIAAGLRAENEAISPAMLALILKIIEIVLQLIGR